MSGDGSGLFYVGYCGDGEGYWDIYCFDVRCALLDM